MCTAFLILVIFIGLRWVPKKTCRLMVYDVPAVRCLGRSWAKIRLTSTFDLQLWLVMNIINGTIASVTKSAP